MFQILLGPVHAGSVDRKPHHTTRGHILLQRRFEHTLDCLQLHVGHSLLPGHRHQLQDWSAVPPSVLTAFRTFLFLLCCWCGGCSFESLKTCVCVLVREKMCVIVQRVSIQEFREAC